MCIHLHATIPMSQPGRLSFLQGKRQSKESQKGGIAVMIALLLTLLLALGGFALDFPYLFVVRGELQNAADAAALRGAACLYRNGNCDASPRTVAPNFDSAKSQAGSAITLNGTGGQMLATAEVSSGYWDMGQAYPGTIGGNLTPGTNDAAAIQVIVKKATGVNGGEVAALLAKLVGIQSFPVGATAVAVLAPPGRAGPDTLFPVALNECFFASPIWDTSNNQPFLANSINAPPSIAAYADDPQIIGQPYRFRISSAYHMLSGCAIGQWTSFNLGVFDAATVKDLISHTAKNKTDGVTEQNIGDGTWLESGTEAAPYKDTLACSVAGDKSCEWVFVPVVANVTNTHTQTPIKGFACLHILSANQGAHYIVAQLGSSALNPECILPDSGGSGPNFGLLGSPRLVR